MTTTTGTSSRQPLTVVTGGSRGIGAAVCARLAADGHDLVVGYRSDRAAAEAVAERVRAAGRRALAVAVDTADAASVDALFDEAATLGTVTGLVNNAGMSGPVGRLADADPAGLSRALDVNVLGYLLCARRAVRDLAASGGGALVNISSAAATLGSPGEYVHYAAAKAAVDTLTVGLAKEVAEDGIRVNCVAPGVIWTEFHADPERPAKQAPGIPLGRAGQPEEIAAAVSWLLTADASYTTGAVLRVAGGR
ncbi:SDR family oxidoreductase [Streptomyces albidoflavus]|jgi:NAD(P)-dependent dehydrogenase (short-subunit alcohol dehydrogenase family)|uniref:KR domain-containing protein n=4 Tax=Streptomyces TaxID=1883 RepID=D6B488_9ACTN|nr:MULTISPECIES: SDR family oxidoreductase [Streptomyces]MYW60222.1 SDR family oxidoreductase [Streptomyces sp. SID8370]MYW84752.1 SDR family oxidoreductase [Streptomyces sp. SID8371]MYX52425.1 SDR family oxidoreductase [Streptomyces sp. SID8385]MYX85973.1 SDR family oxidoreductase [Streptomyces sp. SID4915]NUW09135.1 SDR family oxidoreductase [Streptomyces sp. CAI-21]NVI32554.1 SDR family oxidoreductase [Streptomyces sp. CAI-17]QLA58551.1 SDR family oxidoreductase [Streptomyces violascens]